MVEHPVEAMSGAFRMSYRMKYICIRIVEFSLVASVAIMVLV